MAQSPDVRKVDYCLPKLAPYLQYSASSVKVVE